MSKRVCMLWAGVFLAVVLLFTGGAVLAEGKQVAATSTDLDPEPLPDYVVEGDVLVAVLARCAHEALPKRMDVVEIQLRGDAENGVQALRSGHLGVEFAGDGDDGLVAQMLQREINQIEIDPFQKDPGGCRDDLLVGSFEPAVLAVREGSPFVEFLDGFYPAEVGETVL